MGRQGRESQARGGCGREGLKARSDRDQWRRQGSREGSLGAFEAETQQVRRPGAWEDPDRSSGDSAFLGRALDCGSPGLRPGPGSA